jgi:hypothetical protein
MDLRLEFRTPINQDCRYLQLTDYDNGNTISYRLGFKHEYLISKMKREDAIRRIELLIKLIVIGFSKKYGIENPYKKLKQVFPMSSEFYNTYGR